MSDYGYYSPSNEGPEARLAREQAEEEERVHKVIVRLYESIPPEASTWDLFTFAERQRWGLRGHRKRDG